MASKWRRLAVLGLSLLSVLGLAVGLYRWHESAQSPEQARLAALLRSMQGCRFVAAPNSSGNGSRKTGVSTAATVLPPQLARRCTGVSATAVDGPEATMAWPAGSAASDWLAVERYPAEALPREPVAPKKTPAGEERAQELPPQGRPLQEMPPEPVLRIAAMRQGLALEDWQGVWLAPRFNLYRPRQRTALSTEERRLAPRVAAAILRGHAPPPLRAFPQHLRAPDRYEVLVVLRHRLRPFIWRSARRDGFAPSLLSAAEAVRSRWLQRRPNDALNASRQNAYTVEVATLMQDGQYAEPLDDAWIHASLAAQGTGAPRVSLGAESRGNWRYLLPGELHAEPLAVLTHTLAQRFVNDGAAQSGQRITYYRYLLDRLATVSLVSRPVAAREP